MHAALEKVRQGFEIVINQGDQPVAVIKTVEFRGRYIDQCIELLRSRGSNALPDEDFARDVQAAIDAHRDMFDPPSWD